MKPSTYKKRAIASIARDSVFLNRHSQPDRIIRRVHQILPRAQITLGSLDRCVAEQQLDLLKLATGCAAQLGTSAPEVMGRDSRNANLRRITTEHLPHDFLAEALTSNRTAAIHRAKYVARSDAGRDGPRIDRYLHPRRHRRSPHPSVFSDEIDDAPAP